MASVSQSVTIALIYTRVSSDEQAREGVSLDTQLAECRRYAAERGWVLGKEYQDVLSGRRDDRREYQALLADVRRLRAQGRAVAVVVMRLDRLGRRLLERVRAREELKGLGVPTHSIREGGEVSDLIANILASVAEEEVRQLGERVAGSFGHIQGNGWKKPGRPPWGYRWRAATGEERARGAPRVVLEIDEEAAPFVRELFDRAARGETIRSLIKWVAGLPARARADRNLGYRSIRAVLARSTYVARTESDRRPDVLGRPPARWPAIVDDETFRRVRERIAAHTHMPRQASGSYLLTGLLRCPRCGARMASGGPNRGMTRYTCRGETKGAAAPAIRCVYTVTMRTVDAAVRAEVIPLVAVVASNDPAVRAAIAREWAALQRPTDEAARHGQRLQALERDAARARDRIKRLALLFADGDIDRSGYDLGRAAAQGDLDAAAAEGARLRGVAASPVLPPLEEVLRAAGSWAAALEGSETRFRREVLGTLMRTIVPHREQRSVYRLEMEWTPTGELVRQLAAGSAVAA
jgi:site-specific DNA recombinase